MAEGDLQGLSDALTLTIALPGSLTLTPDPFAELCTLNPDALLKRALDLEAIRRTPQRAQKRTSRLSRSFGGASSFGSNGGGAASDRAIIAIGIGRASTPSSCTSSGSSVLRPTAAATSPACWRASA